MIDFDDLSEAEQCLALAAALDALAQAKPRGTP
jgi:hypothetical protein